jgi:hypothetical protein
MLAAGSRICGGMESPVALDVGLVGGGGPKPNSAASSRSNAMLDASGVMPLPQPARVMFNRMKSGVNR